MDCSFVRKNLFSYQEKLLSFRDHEEFEAHLRTCAACSSIVSDFLSLTTLIDAKKTAEPNPFAGTRLIQRLESESQKYQVRYQPLLYRIIQPVSVSLLLLTAVITGFSIVKQAATGKNEDIGHNNNISAIQSGLNIPDFIDEEYTFTMTP